MKRIIWIALISVCSLVFTPGKLVAQDFEGFDSAALPPVTNTLGDWGLKIVIMKVGQADAILVMTPNGDTCLIDSGKNKSNGNQIADLLSSKTLNRVGNIKTVDLLYTTHYDLDHIGGLPQFPKRGISIRKAFDQGLSKKRLVTIAAGRRSPYGGYVAMVGDSNDNMRQDSDEPNFVRHRMHYGHVEHIGLEDQVEIRCVSVKGDTEGSAYDYDLNPADRADFDENPGSIALLIRLCEFEFYTAGDQTDDDWKTRDSAGNPMKPVEEAVLDSGAIVGGNDIDVIKVSHHGSDSSTSKSLAKKMVPEVAIISTEFVKGQNLPKKIVLKQFQDNRCYVLITGDGKVPSTQDYSDSAGTHEDDDFVVLNTAVFNDQGNVTVLVSSDGSRYTVIGSSFARTFSARDTDNRR